MKRFLQFIILLPVAIIGLAFAVANRHDVIVSFNPFADGMTDSQITAPLFVVLILALMCGVVLGGIVTWLAQGRHRRALREARNDAQRWRSQAERLQAERAQAIQAASSSPSAASREPAAAESRRLLMHS